MFRITNSLKTLSVSLDAFVPNASRLESVRWKRKPRWLPVAKSKMFRIPPRPEQRPGELEELKRLNNNYRTQIKSLRRYLRLMYATELHQTDDAEHQQKEFEEDLARCVAINDNWNESIRVEREARFQGELEANIQLAKGRVIAKQERDLKELEDAEELVRKQKGLVETFITEANIDEAIEKAMSSTVDYNFAIDLHGNRTVGREASPEEVDLRAAVKQ